MENTNEEKMTKEPDNQDEIQEDEDQEYEEFTIPITPGDTISTKLTWAFDVNGRTQWAAAETTLAALPDETADDVSYRSQLITFQTVVEQAHRLEEYIDEMRKQQTKKKEGN